MALPQSKTDSDEDEVLELHQQQQPADSSDLDCALFWSEMPENKEDHPDIMAMEAMAAESTPEERAHTFKVNGNRKLQMGVKVRNKLLLREAVELYTKGLSEKGSDPALNAILLCNRAHAESTLGNWRKALQDAVDALALDETNVKAYFRAARAACKLGQWEQCQDLCARGRRHLGGGKDEFEAVEKEAAARAAEAKAAQQKAEAAEEVFMRPAKALAQAITSRGIQLTAPQVRTRGDQWRPTLEADGSLCWPVVLAYPEAGMAQDTIEEFHESATIAQHLDVMFGPEAPPLEWDTDHAYTRDRVKVYYLSRAGEPLKQGQLVEVLRHGQWPKDFDDAAPKQYGPEASRWEEVDERQRLSQLLTRPDYVVPGAPLLWVVASGTDYAKRFELERKH